MAAATRRHQALSHPTLGASPPAARAAALRRRAPYFAYLAGAAVARAAPPGAAEAMASGLGPVLAVALPRRRAMLERHLRRVLGPHLARSELARQVRGALSSYARYWVESFRLRGTDAVALAAGVRCTGLEHIDDALARGHGAVLALPHLGGWDVGGAWLASLGYPLTVVVEPLEPPELFAWFADLRRSLGIDVVPLGPAAGPSILRRLAEGAVVALVCDRDLPGTGVEVEFFGERTTLPSGPAMLALRTGAALLPTAVYFDGPRRHHAVIHPPLPAERTGRLRHDVARLTQRLAHELEELIGRAPDQWHLLQPNWPSDRSPPGAMDHGRRPLP